MAEMTWIKICGITNVEDALKAASLGVDALGFVFAPGARRVDPSTAREIVRMLPAFLIKVGVFLDQDVSEVREIAAHCGLDALQFHGEESPEYCRKFSQQVIKTIRIKGPESLNAMKQYRMVRILLDTYSPTACGGTGIRFPVEIALKAKEEGDFILSGGLNPSVVQEVIRKVRPVGVDVSSGVEISPGKKDVLKMSQFMKEVRRADENTG
jgi:phosphoribosylanthranilate isomerase